MPKREDKTLEIQRENLVDEKQDKIRKLKKRSGVMQFEMRFDNSKPQIATHSTVIENANCKLHRENLNRVLRCMWTI